MQDLQLFCLPYAGGSAAFFQELEKLLGPRVQVIGIEPSGHGYRLMEEPHTTLDDYLADVLDQMLAEWQGGPFAVLGYSMGSTAAYHLFFRLRERGMVPRHLFFMANTAPYVADEKPLSSDQDDDEFLAQMVQLGGVPDGFLSIKGIVELYMPVLRADVLLEELGQTEQPRTIDCDMDVIYSSFDNRDGLMGEWTRCAGGRISFHEFEGTHFFLADHGPEVAGIVAEACGIDLEEA